MRVRTLLAGAAILVGSMAIALPASAATNDRLPHFPQGNNCQQQGDQHWKNGDGNCCQFPQDGIFPFGSDCGFPQPVCHEVTTWTESWSWNRWSRHLVPSWHKHVTLKCVLPPAGNPPSHCIPQNVTIMFNNEGGTSTNDVVHAGEVLVNSTDHLTETVTSVHPLIIAPATGIENNVLNFQVAGSCQDI